MNTPLRPDADDATADVVHRVVLDVEYEGSQLSGWSVQPGRRTVEGELRASMASLGAVVERTVCAGRTDAGVHAQSQVVSLDYRGSIDPAKLLRAFAGTLPTDIAVTAVRVVDESFDARGSATSRAYRYRVLTRSAPSPLRMYHVLHHPRPLDEAVLHACADAARGQHHFGAFTPLDTEHVFFHRTVIESKWERSGDELIYTVRANAFLRRMVRMLVGTMLATARGEQSVDDFRAMIASGTRPAGVAVNTAASHGLCLIDVTFDPIEGVPPNPTFSRTDESSPGDAKRTRG